MQDTRVRSLSWEDPLEKEMEPTPIFLPVKSHGQSSLAGYSPWSCKESDMSGDLARKFCLNPGSVSIKTGTSVISKGLSRSQ